MPSFPDILGGIGKVFDSVRGVVDDLHTSDEEKAKMKKQIAEVENQAYSQMLDHVQNITKMQRDVIVAEAQGESWLQRSWRPLLMLTFALIIVFHWFGLAGTELPVEIQEWMYRLITLGVGGYIGGRTVEKVSKQGGVKSVTKGVMEGMQQNS